MFRQIIHIVPNGIIINMEPIVPTTNNETGDNTKIETIKN